MRVSGLLAVVLVAAPLYALDIVEMKDGRVLEAEKVTFLGDRLRIKLHLPKGDQTIEFAVRLEKVVPEFVYYAWNDQIADHDVAEMAKLAAWSRTQGLFGLAQRAYERAADTDAGVRAKLPELEREMHAEEATWHVEEAWRLFRDNDVQAARVHVERVLEQFGDTKEVGRAQGLLTIVKEREQFLDEQKLQKEIDARARKQRKVVDRHLDRIDKADRLVLGARFKYVSDAKRRLQYAAYTYRKAALEFADMLGFVEVDDLRLTLKALLEDLDRRLVRTFLKLGDLRYLTGDAPGALDAVHEVLAVEPGNKDAGKLRDRLLDGGAAVVPVRATTGYPLLGSRFRRSVYACRPSLGRSSIRGFGIYVPRSTIRIGFRFGYDG